MNCLFCCCCYEATKQLGLCLHDAIQGHAETPELALHVPMWGQKHESHIRAALSLGSLDSLFGDISAQQGNVLVLL